MDKPNKEVIINSIFGELIYQSFIDDFENINKEIIPHIEKFVKKTPGRFAATTDVKDTTQNENFQGVKDDLHLDKKYENLFNQIRKNIKAFLRAKKYDENKFDAHITKSWATYSTKDQHIASHRHTASHYSACYYVRAEEMGNLWFEEDQAAKRGLFIPPSDEYITNWNRLNFPKYLMKAKSGSLVIFPGILPHETQPNTKNVPRISISSDILLTMKEGVKAEHCIPHPTGWMTV